MIKRRNRISQQFSAHLIEMLESPSFCALSRAAHLVIARIEIELAHHGGNDNGKLPVTTEDFVRYGLHRASVAPAIREAEALGFINVKRGHGGNAEHRSPSHFFLTFAHARDSRARQPTHAWRRIKTTEEAEQIAAAARANKCPTAVALGRRSWRKQKNKSRFASSGPEPAPKSGAENGHFPPPESGATGHLKNRSYSLESG